MTDTATLAPAERVAPAPRPRAPQRSWLVTAVLAFVVAMTWWSADRVGFSIPEMIDNFRRAERIISELSQPGFAFWPRVVQPFVETVQIALVGTAIGALLALPVAFLAARPTTPGPVTWIVDRNFMNVVRTLPDLFWAMIFVSAVGIGPFAGGLALTMFSLAVVSKLLSETIDGIDPGPAEAAEAAGGSRMETITLAVMPQVLPQYVAYVLYVFELNIRASTVIGLVGAGGIGMVLEVQRKLYRYDRVMLIVLLVFAAVLVIEQLSQALRRRLV
ncbi:MAG: phosphonate ABC transporter, permease protein PhnE [Actinomycetota bacterium]|nr:phosphonate ABC transporter, permease protein PhnE [Actinomycetota bacterium]